MTGFALMQNIFIAELKRLPMEVVAIEKGEREKRDKENKMTGMENFIKITAEVPRGNGIFSRFRFEVKVVDGAVKITPSELDESVYSVSFENLIVSYIDQIHSRIYFRADNYTIEKVVS